MNEQDTMNNEIEIREAVDSTTEASSTGNSASENDNTPEKGRAKTVKRIVLGVSLPILALIIVFGALFLTLNPSIALQNTLETFGVNIRSFSSLEQKFQTKGIKGYYNIEIPYSDSKQNSLVTIYADVAMSPQKGTADITLSNLKTEQNLTVNFVYTDKFMALKNGNENYTGISLENLKEALDASIFHPDSDSKFALSKSDYDAIISYLEGDKSEENVLDEETVEEITEMFQNILKILKTEDKIVFSKEPFGLCKRVEYTVNKTTLTEIAEYLKKEFEENEKFAPIFKIESIEKAEFEDLLDTLLESFKEEDYFKISYLVYLGRIKNVTVSTYQQANETTSNANNITVDFEYGINKSSILCSACEEVTTKSSTKTDNATAEITLSKNKKINTYVFTALDDPNNENENEGEVNELHGKLIHNTEDGKFYLTFGTTEERKDLYVEGNILLSNRKGEMRFTLTRFVTAKMDMDWEVIDINLKVLRSSPNTSVEYDNILSMDNKEFTEFLTSLPFAEIDNIISPALGGSKLFTYSEDDKVILNTTGLNHAYSKYSIVYKEYIVDNISQSERVDQIFIYDEDLSLYFVLEYKPNSQTIYVKMYYELPSNVIKEAHEANLNGTYKDKLEIHKLEKIPTISPTCSKEGKEGSMCTRCGKEYCTLIPKTEHKMVERSISFKTDENKICTGIANQCSVCDEIHFTSDSVNINISPSDEGYIVTKYEALNGYSCFSIPKELVGNLKVVGIDIENVQIEATVIRIPVGFKSLDFEYFYDSNPQVIVIPSSVVKIDYGAFMSTSSIHTVYYIGTEDSWKKIDLTEWKDDFEKIEIQFVSEEPSPEDLSLLNIKLLTQKQIETLYGEKAANNRIKDNPNLNSIFQSENIISYVEYDYENELLAIMCHDTYYTKSFIYIYDLDGNKKGEFTYSEHLIYLSIGNGYIAAGSYEIPYIFLFNISTGEETEIKIGGTKDYITSSEIIDGNIYFTTYLTNRVSCLNLETGKTVTITSTTKFPYIEYIREKELLLVTDTHEKKFHLIDIKNGNKKTTYTTSAIIYGYNQTSLPEYVVTENDIIYDLEGNEYDKIPDSLNNFKSTPGKLLHIISLNSKTLSKISYQVGGQLNTYIQTDKMSTPFIIENYYGGKVQILNSGDVLFNTGYGVYIIEAK